MSKSLFLAITLGTAVLTGTAFAASGSDTDRQTLGRADTWLTIPAVYETVTAAGYRNINDIERERNGYEVKAISPRGERVKLYVEPDQRGNPGRARQTGQRPMGRAEGRRS